MDEKYANKQLMEQIHESIYKELGEVNSTLKEIRSDGKKTLIQTTKTNGRVSALESLLWKFVIPVFTAVTVYIITTQVLL
jgi:hypothetical protein